MDFDHDQDCDWDYGKGVKKIGIGMVIEVWMGVRDKEGTERDHHHARVDKDYAWEREGREQERQRPWAAQESLKEPESW